MGSVCMAERKSRRCRMKVKPKRAGRHPCQRQTGVFFQNRPPAEMCLHGKAYAVSSNQK